MARALKVYRTPIGFHDAYVAAPSQTAALRAWGTEHNLFARGAAELVTDPALTAAPLAAPGEVIKLLRGSAEEQMAAATPVPARAEEPASPKDAKAGKAGKAAKPAPPLPPRPSRAALDRAEAAVAAAEAAHADEIDAINARIAALEQERRALERTADASRAKLEAARDKAEVAHKAALEKWRAAIA